MFFSDFLFCFLTLFSREKDETESEKNHWRSTCVVWCFSSPESGFYLKRLVA